MVHITRFLELPRSVMRRGIPGSLVLAALALPGLALAGTLTPDHATRIADPKLRQCEIEIRYNLQPSGAQEDVVVELLDGGTVVYEIFDDVVTGADDPIELSWDGRGAGGAWIDNGDYTLRVRLKSGGSPVDYPISLVRLGIVEIEAHSSLYSGSGSNPPVDEWQMVYFKKGSSTTSYYATPATGEYVSRAENGDVSDLDLNDGSPRPFPPLHQETDQPVLEGGNYDTNSHNYPVCYLQGVKPAFEVTFGATSTTAAGASQGANYPVAGYDIRCFLKSGKRFWKTRKRSIQPGGKAIFYGPVLPSRVSRKDRRLEWTFEYKAVGDTEWSDVPGSFTTLNRFYTVIDTPEFASGASGTQYAGPWVEVAEYVTSWAGALDLPTADDHEVMSALILGFFGQQGPLTTAIEGVIYDCYPMGGDGGANHYFDAGQHRIHLSSLLANHKNGVYLNCSDCAGSTSTMAAMMGIDDVQLVHLGPMSLKAIWGIGCPAYTTNLWGSGHGFSYHKIITRTGGVEVCDACMCLDEDGDPTTTPGIPGYNCDRPWAGANGYNQLSSYNNVNKSLQDLPRLR